MKFHSIWTRILLYIHPKLQMTKTNFKYKVTHFIDCGAWIDPNPTIKYFEEWNEMEDYATEETQRRIDYTIQHSPFTISEEEYKEIEEYENSMYKIEEITNNGLKLIKGWVNSNIF